MAIIYESSRETFGAIEEEYRLPSAMAMIKNVAVAAADAAKEKMKMRIIK